MNSVPEIVTMQVTYQPALLALALLCIAVLVQSLLSAPLAFVSEEQVPGMPLKGGHDLLSFRVLRTYSNSVESLPAFGIALFLAIFLGATPSIVNWAAVIHVIFRVAFWLAYYSGTGRIAGGPRTIFYVGGLVSNFVLAGLCVYSLVI